MANHIHLSRFGQGYTSSGPITYAPGQSIGPSSIGPPQPSACGSRRTQTQLNFTRKPNQDNQPPSPLSSHETPSISASRPSTIPTKRSASPIHHRHSSPPHSPSHQLRARDETIDRLEHERDQARAGRATEEARVARLRGTIRKLRTENSMLERERNRPGPTVRAGGEEVARWKKRVNQMEDQARIDKARIKSLEASLGQSLDAMERTGLSMANKAVNARAVLNLARSSRAPPSISAEFRGPGRRRRSGYLPRAIS